MITLKAIKKKLHKKLLKRVAIALIGSSLAGIGLTNDTTKLLVSDVVDAVWEE